jgi:hypothetical protein
VVLEVVVVHLVETQVGVEALMAVEAVVVLTHLMAEAMLALALVEVVQLSSYHNA